MRKSGRRRLECRASGRLRGRRLWEPHAKLLPWARKLTLDNQTIEALVNRLVTLASAQSGLPLTEPRAMGWAGPNADNPQIERLRESGKLQEVNQTGQLATHSAMWFPDQRLFEQIVRGEVIRRFFQQGQPGFGQYKFRGS